MSKKLSSAAIRLLKQMGSDTEVFMDEGRLKYWQHYTLDSSDSRLPAARELEVLGYVWSDGPYDFFLSDKGFSFLRRRGFTSWRSWDVFVN